MKRFENLLIRTKLYISFGLIWVMLSIIIGMAYIGIKQITNSEQELHDVYFIEALQLELVRSYQNYNRASMLQLLMAKNEVEKTDIIKSIKAESDSINTIIDNLFLLNSDPVFQNSLNNLKKTQNAYQETRNEIVNLIKEGKLDEAQALLNGIQNERYNEVRNIALTLGNNASAKATGQLQLDMKEARSLIMIFILVGIAVLIFSFIIITFMNTTVAKPLNDISLIATGIASGDLSVDVKSSNRKDEVGLLNSSFYKMVLKLRGSIKEISEGVNLLGSSASEILAATTQVASGSAETASAISETTTTVEEVRQAAQLSNQKASRVSENAQQVSLVTQQGQTSVEETVNGMNEIQNQMESIADTIVRLSEQSQQIGGIIASVNDVADQSNLLAVNASIEAAKAGEHGKGFAVVAQEIKNLALQSKQATIQVRNILSDIQKSTSSAVMAMEQGSKAVGIGVKQSKQAGEAIKKLSESSSRSLDAANQIVASSQQQVVGMDQIAIAMNNINQAGAENAASMKQAEVAAKDLNELGQKLKHFVEQYKL